ncbi:helix-turn-helix domain-containing protein [Streptomyces sp. CAU 1734]|uniref:helix-turn-helix domain-containing protein n=1 Tax=Streptomyces sp. CAU 1734 TaxID=3140360 RepID=UPI003261079A
MRVHLSARTRAFTVLGNDVLQDRRLSFTARGLLAYLLSLPDGAREDVRTLADRHPGVGRLGIARALDELIALGYYVRRTVRDRDSGRIRTETSVRDQPDNADGLPLPVPPGTGGATAGRAGAFPKGKKNQGKKPPTPCPGTGGKTEAPARAVALLARIGVVEPKLALGAAEVVELAPLAAPWVERGLSDLQMRNLLTGGLPPVVHSAKSLLANRLVRKLPPVRPVRDPVAPAAPPAECGRCREPLPRGATACGRCDTSPAAGTNTPPGVPDPGGVARHMRTLRTALRRDSPAEAAARG